MKKLINIENKQIEEYNRAITRENIIKNLKEAEAEIKRGEGIEASAVFMELRQKYGY